MRLCVLCVRKKDTKRGGIRACEVFFHFGGGMNLFAFYP